jgi:isopenicillin N synthase-like dioxygenase
MSSLHAKLVDKSTLPMISIKDLRSTDRQSRMAVGHAIRNACMDTGFFYICDHGVPSSLMDAVLSEARRFFALPLEQKLRLDMANSYCARGYEPIGKQTLEFGTPPDRKESFQISRELPQDDPRVIARVINHGPNQWPADLPGWRETCESYLSAMTELATLLMSGIALSLALPEQAFRDFCEEPIATLRLLHYPPQPAHPKPNEKGCGAHTDWGALTILLQDNVGGLQVWDEHLGWIHAAPIPGTYVVNLGDMMARWTNDRYRSTRHRVVNVSGRDRTSVPFFFDGKYDYVVSCIPTCLDEGEAPKYEATTPMAHLAEMIRLTYPGE